MLCTLKKITLKVTTSHLDKKKSQKNTGNKAGV